MTITTEIRWTTIIVHLIAMDPIAEYGGEWANHPDSNSTILPDWAEVTIREGEVSSVSIKGIQLTKAGVPSKSVLRKVTAIGHTELEATIGNRALAQLEKEVRHLV